jgi:hypothetical protein
MVPPGKESLTGAISVRNATGDVRARFDAVARSG